MRKLRENYDGKYEVEMRKTQASEEFKKLHYSNEHSLPFEKYTTALQINSQVLERFAVSINEEDNITYLFNKMYANNI